MVFGTRFTRFMFIAEPTFSAVSGQLICRWRTAPFVRLTTGAWRRIFTRDALNGVLPGPGISPISRAFALREHWLLQNEAMLRPGGPGNDGSASAGFARGRARLGTPPPTYWLV